MGDISYSAFVELANDLFSQQRYFEAHCNLKKAGDLILELYNSTKVGTKKAGYMRELLNNRHLTQQLEMHIDFDRFKAHADARILESIQVPDDACIGECSNIFRKYCNENVLEVVVYESEVWFLPHLRALRFLLRTLKRLCSNLCYFKLKCKKNTNFAELQAHLLHSFERILVWDCGVHFEYEILQQRCFDKPKIVFNTGIVFYFDAGFKFFVYADDPQNESCRGLERHIDIWETNIWPV